MTPEEASGYIDGLSFGSKQDVWGEFPNRYDHWDAFEAFETIANLRYEYAAQIRQGDASQWLYVRNNGHFSKRGSTSVWCKKRKGCETAIRSALQRKDIGADTVEFRIVRRLVGDPEVEGRDGC